MKEIKQKRNTFAVVLVVLAMVFYGISFPATRIALNEYNPVSLITLRLLISSVILMIINILIYKRRAIPIKKDFPIFLLIAAFQPFLYFLLETYGLSSVSAAVSSLIIATIPVFTPIISRFFIREKLTMFNFAGLVLSFTGVILLVAFSDSNMSEKSFTVPGLLLLFGAVLAAVFYTIIVKKLPHTYSALTITAVQNTLGLFLFLPVFFILDVKDFITVVPSINTLVSIVFLAIFASSLAFIFLNFGIKKLGPSKANGFVNLVPVVTAFVSFAFFKESFSLYKILGMIVILSGVLIAQKKRKKPKNS
ncbi:MAG: DMT family transporter [Bacteroidetes bacterium]|nr:DMT family transporter [Bacteroidota bacterium]